MTWRYRSLSQAAIVVVVGSVLGVGYNALTHKGMFSPKQAGYGGGPALKDGRYSEGGAPWPTVDRSGTPAGRSTSPKGANQPTSLVPISRDEALALFDSGGAVFVDARHKIDYDCGHIRGAISLPVKTPAKEFLSVTGGLARDVPTVTYCDGAECNSSLELAVRLEKAGFRNVKVFFGGWNEWQAGRLPTEGTK